MSAIDTINFEAEIERCQALLRNKSPAEQIAFASEMVRCWQATGVRALERMYAYPNPIPKGRFEDLIVDACNSAILRVLRDRGVLEDNNETTIRRTV